MGVYIKGMELPNEGVEWICFVRLTNRTAEFFDPTGEYESVFYKALEVPEHVRLVDADAFAAEMKERQNEAGKWLRDAKDHDTAVRADAILSFLSEVKLTLDKLPTVIPEEEA